MAGATAQAGPPRLVATGEEGPVTVYKFIIRADVWRKLPGSDLEVCGCVAATIAESQEQAKKNLERYAAENGMDSRWLEVADVIQLPVDPGVVIAWVMT